MIEVEDLPNPLADALARNDALNRAHRAGYLAGIAAARGCVPEAFTRIDYIKNRVSDDEAAGHNACRNLTLANLDALGRE